MSAGVSRQHENVIAFTARQRLDTVAPSDGLLTNPEFLEHTVQQAGMNLVRGAHNLVEDRERAISGKRPVGADEFEVGRNLAVTPGKVNRSEKEKPFVTPVAQAVVARCRRPGRGRLGQKPR